MFHTINFQIFKIIINTLSVTDCLDNKAQRRRSEIKLHNLKTDFHILLSGFMEKILLFKYFQRMEIPKEESLTVSCESLNLRKIDQYASLLEKLKVFKRFYYVDKCVWRKKKARKLKLLNLHQNKYRKFKKKFLSLTESTI